MRSLPSPSTSRLIVLAFLLSAGASIGTAAPLLDKEPSALLKSQAASPIEWAPWSEAALQRAQREQKPVFVAVGVFTSELSRAMSRQTFSNADVGALLNENFVCILVDAKERPDVAALYQNYLQAAKQVSGPPMNLWLTPELKPFEGANYLPPTEEWGKEGFITVSKRVASAWKTDAAAQRRKADEAVATVEAAQPQGAAPALDAAQTDALLKESGDLWRARFDAANGGFGEAPKHAEPELLRFLLARDDTRDMAVKTLQILVDGALRDPLDGGFFRYVVDPEGRQPYFQKLLVDQPRLALALLDAARVTSETRYADAARGALRYALDHLALPGGDFSAAEDISAEAATNGYFWTLGELRDALGETAATEFARLHGVTETGNIPEDAFPGLTTKGKSLLRRAEPIPAAGIEKSVSDAAAKLRSIREQRVTALRDDNAPSGTHGLLLTALARAGAELKDAKFAAAAKAEAGFIRERLLDKNGGLLRLAGRSIPASAADYALVIEGLRTYAALTKDAKAEQLALDLLRAGNAQFLDAAAGRYFAAPAGAPGFWARVYSPAPSAGEPPTAEPAMLSALAVASVQDAATKDLAAQLVRTIAADIKNSPEAPRGDLLLALQAATR
jgi:hypothetical protein